MPYAIREHGSHPYGLHRAFVGHADPTHLPFLLSLPSGLYSHRHLGGRGLSCRTGILRACEWNQHMRLLSRAIWPCIQQNSVSSWSSRESLLFKLLLLFSLSILSFMRFRFSMTISALKLNAASTICFESLWTMSSFLLSHLLSLLFIFPLVLRIYAPRRVLYRLMQSSTSLG